MTKDELIEELLKLRSEHPGFTLAKESLCTCPTCNLLAEIDRILQQYEQARKTS